jgi:hypothetical protein
MVTLTDVVNVFTIISLLVASYVAIMGLNTWKEQTKRKFDWELARRCLKSIYKVRDTIGRARSAFISSEEYSHAMNELKKHNPEIDIATADKDRVVYAQRFNAVLDAKDELGGELLEVEAAWGKAARDTISGIDGSVRQLWIAIQLFLTSKGQALSMNSQPFIDLYDMSTADKPDEFTNELQKRIGIAEEYLIGKLKL